MKKIFIILSVICVCALTAFTFSACGTTNLQGNSWEDKEIFDYTAKENGVVTGTLTIKSARIARNVEAVRIDELDKSFSVSGGTKIETAFTGNDGRSMYSIGLLDASNKTPVASYRIEKDAQGNVVNESKAVYRSEGNKYVCSYSYKNEKGEISKGEFKQSGIFCDNAAIYFLLRTYTHTGLSQSLSVPSFPNGKVITLKAASVAVLTSSGAAVSVSEKKSSGEPVLSTKNSFEVTRIGISLGSTPSGEPNFIDYTVENAAQSFGRASNPSTKIPYRIQEGSVEYLLNALTVSA